MSKDIKIQHGGFSVEMTNFSIPYKKWVEERKRRVKYIAKQFISLWARNVQYLSRVYAPESGVPTFHSLVNSIQVSTITVTNGGNKLVTQVGVGGWHSGFDDWYRFMFGKLPPWGLSSVELLINLHENWDTIVQQHHRSYAKQRAARKSARYGGVKVGSKFLYRGALDSSTNRALAKTQKELIRQAMAKGDFVLAGTIGNIEVTRDV